MHFSIVPAQTLTTVSSRVLKQHFYLKPGSHLFYQQVLILRCLKLRWRTHLLLVVPVSLPICFSTCFGILRFGPDLVNLVLFRLLQVLGELRCGPDGWHCGQFWKAERRTFGNDELISQRQHHLKEVLEQLLRN